MNKLELTNTQHQGLKVGIKSDEENILLEIIEIDISFLKNGLNSLMKLKKKSNQFLIC